MVNLFVALKPLFHMLMKMAGLRAQTVEIEPGTVMQFWVPIQSMKNPNKPVLVFLHGFAADGFLTWIFQVAGLMGKYTFYIPDFLFFGGSFSKSNERSPKFQAECVVKGLKKLGVEKCGLVAFSYGGLVGFKMAELYPNLVQCLVVSGSVVALTESISGASLEQIGFRSWSDFLIPKTVEGLKLLFSVGTHWKPRFPDGAYRHFMEFMIRNREERAELLEALVSNEKDNITPTFSESIHLIFGESDKIFDLELAHTMKLQLGDKATLHIIEKAGHLVHLERPFVYNTCLNKILASFETNGPRD